jgi:hypothetical protein
MVPAAQITDINASGANMVPALQITDINASGANMVPAAQIRASTNVLLRVVGNHKT